MKTTLVRIVFGMVGTVLLAGAVCRAEDAALASARAAGMAGANAASVRDATAQWYNPAAFGFFGRSEWASNAVDNADLSGQGFSWDLVGVGGGYAMTENMGRYLDILADIDFDDFDSGNLSSNPDNVHDLLSMVGVVGAINESDSLLASASAGTALQIGRFGIGLRMFGEAAAWAQPDTANLVLDGYATTAALVGEIGAAALSEGFAWDGTYYLSAQQRSDLATALGVTPTSSTIQYLDDKIAGLAADGDLTDAEIANAVALFGRLVPGAGGSIDDNLTTLVGRGFAVAEIPVSYGWALNKILSIGATVKVMQGHVLGTKVWLFGDDNDTVLEDISDTEEASFNVGLDVGVLYRMPKFQFAVVGHNLNKPSFSGFTDTIEYTINGGATQVETITVPDVEIDPQITIGAAFMPSRRLTLESNFDLLETGTLLPGYDVQRVSFGGELDVWVLAFRAGAYRNLAESWQDWVATAGVGVNLLGMKVDMGCAYSLGDDVEYDGNKIPSEGRFYASIGMDF